jgi:hypothetical protein
MSAKVSLKGVSIRDWTDLFTNDDREFFMEITRNGGIVFRGYLLPDVHSQAHTPSTHAVEIMASDGLGSLKYTPFVDENGNNYTGRLSYDEIATLIVAKCNLDYTVHWCIDWNKVTLNNTYVVNQYYVDVSFFYRIKPDASCADVLTWLLESLNARIYQSGGRFLVEQPYTLADSAKMKFHYGPNDFSAPSFADWASEFVELDRYSDSACQINASTPNILMRGDSTLEVYPATKGARVVEKMWPVNLADSFFSGRDAFDPLLGSSFRIPVEGWIPNPAIQDSNDLSAPIFLPKDWSGDVLVDFRGNFRYVGSENRNPVEGVGVQPKYDAMYMSVVPGRQLRPKKLRHLTKPVHFDPNASFRISMSFECLRFAEPVVFYFSVRIGSFWLSNNAKEWLPYEEFLSFTFGESDFGQEKKLEFDTPRMPSFNTLQNLGPNPVEIVIYQPEFFQPRNTPENDNRFAFKFNRMAIGYLVNGSALVSQDTRSFKNQGFYNAKEAEAQIELGGWQRNMNPSNARTLYPAAITFGKNEDSQVVTVWRDESGYVSDSLAELVFRQLVAARKRNRERINAELSGHFEFGQRLRVLADPLQKTYFCVGLSYDSRMDRLSGEFVELQGREPVMGGRLLEDGTPHRKENDKGSLHERNITDANTGF